jgi:arginase
VPIPRFKPCYLRQFRPTAWPLVGLHAWTDDDFPNIDSWGLTSFSPDDLRESSQRLLDWLAGTGCTRVAMHFDVDTVDSNEIVLGLGAEPDGADKRSGATHPSRCQPVG